jgi:hypothetical protein
LLYNIAICFIIVICPKDWNVGNNDDVTSSDGSLTVPLVARVASKPGQKNSPVLILLYNIVICFIIVICPKDWNVGIVQPGHNNFRFKLGQQFMFLLIFFFFSLFVSFFLNTFCKNNICFYLQINFEEF